MKAYVTLALALSFALSPLITEPFTGFREDQLPLPQLNPAIQPAGYAFSIWGVIYLWLIAGAGFGVLKRCDNPAWGTMRLWLIVSLGIGTFWLWIANTSALWATLTIWMMLASAIAALKTAPKTDRWFGRAPVALYAGWLSAASFVSLAVLLAGNGIGPGGLTWAYILIPVALVLAAYVQISTQGAPEYGIAVAWALIGIVVANWAGVAGVAALAGFSAGIIAGLALRSARAV